MLLFASTTSFLNDFVDDVDDENKQEEDEEVVLITRLLDVVGDEVCRPEASAGAFNIFFSYTRETKQGKKSFIT